MRCYNLDHALAVGQLYFSERPKYWAYEPREAFEHDGRKLEWRPDCLLSYNGKLYAVEVQRSYPPGKSPWAKKWAIYGAYFNGGHFRTAQFQQWAKNPPLLPNFLVVTNQNPQTVTQGFEIAGRELLVVKNL